MQDTRLESGLDDSPMYDGTVSNTALILSTRPNISETHSEISTRVPFCIAAGHTYERQEIERWLRNTHHVQHGSAHCTSPLTGA